MVLITEIKHPIINEYVQRLLRKHGILTTKDFYVEDTHKLVQFTNTSFTEMIAVKQFIRDTYGVTPLNGLTAFKCLMANIAVIPTGIMGLDNILDGGLVTGNLIEICGLSGVGKTQLVNTIALNIASKPHRIGTLYVDAKHDFSGMRLYSTLIAREGSNKNCGDTMQLIKIARIYDVAGLLGVLHELLRNIDKYDGFKVLVVDSLPALWFLYHGDDFRQGLAHLTQVTQLLRKLAVQHNKVVLLVNLVTRSDSDQPGKIPTMNRPADVPALGQYWQSVPSVRLQISTSITTPHLTAAMPANATRPSLSNTAAAAPMRLIRIVKSNRHESGKSVTITITAKGVV